MFRFPSFSWCLFVVVSVAAGVTAGNLPAQYYSVLVPTYEDAGNDRPSLENPSGADGVADALEASTTPDVDEAGDGQTDAGDQETAELHRQSQAPITDLEPEILDLRDRARDCLSYYWQRPQDVTELSPWAAMHAAIGLGVDTQVVVRRQSVNAIGWLCWNGTCRDWQLFEVGKRGLEPLVGPGVQGHSGQFLSVLAFARVPKDYELRAKGQRFTVGDLVEYEKRTCTSGSELTFKLIGLVHYLPSDEVWSDDRGGSWSIPRLLREELAQPINGAACGGTHRLMGFSYAVRKREQRGEPIEGQWLRAQKYVDAYLDYVFKFQNEDGGFSTQWFRSRSNAGDIDRHLETTGHIVEWLVVSLPQEQLFDSRVVTSVDYLVGLLSENRTRDWPAGARGHALHALAVYEERITGSTPGQRAFLQVAARRSD